MKETVKAAIIITAFVAYYVASKYFGNIMVHVNTVARNGLASYVLTYFIIGIPIFAGAAIVNRQTNALKAVGLFTNIPKGFVLAFAFALPMLINSFVSHKFQSEISIANLLAGTIVAGFFEETYFRGFLFGQLFRHTRAGFIVSVVAGAIIFATGHLYQSDALSEQLGIFLVTFLGSGFFAWLYVEWNYNLWVSMFLHTFMNFAWMGFSVSDNALGSTYANIFRAMTIAVAIIATVIYKIKTGKKFEVNRETVWVRKS